MRILLAAFVAAALSLMNVAAIAQPSVKPDEAQKSEKPVEAQKKEETEKARTEPPKTTGAKQAGDARLPAGATRVASVEGITEYRLANGLKVLLFPDLSKPTVTVNITYLVGSRL